MRLAASAAKEVKHLSEGGWKLKLLLLLLPWQKNAHIIVVVGTQSEQGRPASRMRYACKQQCSSFVNYAKGKSRGEGRERTWKGSELP